MKMKALLAFILMSGVYGRSINLIPEPNVMLAENSADGSVNESYLKYKLPYHDDYDQDSYYHNQRLHDEVYAKLKRYYLDKLRYKEVLPIETDKDIQKTAYLLIKTMKQRNKRYTSYLTMCHFKICNMGRKRTTRYFAMIKSLHDDHK